MQWEIQFLWPEWFFVSYFYLLIYSKWIIEYYARSFLGEFVKTIHLMTWFMDILRWRQIVIWNLAIWTEKDIDSYIFRSTYVDFAFKPPFTSKWILDIYKKHRAKMCKFKNFMALSNYIDKKWPLVFDKIDWNLINNF